MEGGVTAMSSLVTALSGILTTDAFMANFTALVPVIGGVLIFAFTYRVVKRVISGAQKGKARV